MTRKDILELVKNTVCNNRNLEYGEPEDNFSLIAELWGGYLGKQIKAHDVAAMMCLFKVARLCNNPSKIDTWVDIACYAACGGEIANKGGADHEAK